MNKNKINMNNNLKVPVTIKKIDKTQNSQVNGAQLLRPFSLSAEFVKNLNLSKGKLLLKNSVIRVN